MNAPETGPLTGRLEQLEFDNSFAALPESFYTRLKPLGLPSPYLVAASDEVAELMVAGISIEERAASVTTADELSVFAEAISLGGEGEQAARHAKTSRARI